MTSSCSKACGICMGDPRCQDLHCPGHPAQSCSSCRPGPCPTPLACEMPITSQAPTRKSFFATPEARGRAIGAALGGAGLIWLMAEYLIYLIT